MTTRETAMSTRTSATRHHDREARRLRGEFLANGMESLLIALDRFVRRIAQRIFMLEVVESHAKGEAPAE